MTKTWSAEELAQICGGELLKNNTEKISGFSIDTRTIKPGDLFVALQGENNDGHVFVDAAVKAKASALLVSRDVPMETTANSAIIKVPDTLKALQEIAAAYRRTFSGTCIGVTGSNGKTTTRSMLHHLLKSKSNCEATAGNLNNHIGLPLTLLSSNPLSDYIVLEMGMNHQGEIRELCRIARPQTSLISNIGPAHIGILGSLENIALAKAEILEHLNSDQVAIIPGDTEFTSLFRDSTRARLFTFGESESCDYQITSLQAGIEEIIFGLRVNGKTFECQLKLAGRHNAFNATAAMAMFHQLGHSLEEACEFIKSYKPVGARMEKVVIDKINILLDCYNANPGSMAEAIKHLAICQPPRIAVLGDMRELGEMSEKLHRELGRQVAGVNPEHLLCIGRDAEFIAQEAAESGMSRERIRTVKSEDEAAEAIKSIMCEGSTVLFKASRGMHLEKVVRKIWPQLGKDLH